MKQEDYVSAECAKLLREKGFDEWCNAYYHLYDKEEIEAGANEDDSFELVGNCSHSFCNSLNHYRVGAPTLYEAQKWLRERFDILVTSNCQRRNEWIFTIWRIIDEDCDFAQPLEVEDRIDGKTYESALNAGILEALKLINE